MYHFATLVEAERTLERFWPSKVARPAYTTEHIQAFMDFLGEPQDQIPAIHIAGTSGKTSTAYYTAALLGKTGKKVGLMVSPHVDSITERVQINLNPISEQLFCTEMAAFLNLVDKSRVTLTYAEILYAFAYWEFARQHVDYMVIEVGLGGLLDATNVISRADKMCVITDIALDHTNVLGKTYKEIATHKAGIIKLHNTVFTYYQRTEVNEAIQKQSKQQQADLHMVRTVMAPTGLPLFQQRNFGLARQVVRFVCERDGIKPLSKTAIKEASTVIVPARMEIHRRGHQIIILDGAHNPQKLAALRQSIAQQFPGESVAVVASFLQSGGRTPSELMKELEPLYAHVIVAVPSVKDHRAWFSVKELQTAGRKAGIGSLMTASNYQHAIDQLSARPERVLVVTGSLYVHHFARQALGLKN